ncbi:hypothetical protein JCM3775_003071 [Rhodotorula graminis]
MSAAVEAAPAPAATLPVEETTTATTPAIVEPTPAAEPALESSEPTTAAAADEHLDGATTPPHKKRQPFAVLNKIFHHKSNPTSPTAETADPIKETQAPAAVVDETPVEAAKPVETTPVAVAETPAVEAEAGPASLAVEEDKKDGAAVKDKKPKSPGVFDKVKSFFGEKEKKDKKVKTPTEEKAEPVAVEAVPVAAATEADAPVAAAPVHAAEPSVVAPEAVALAEASAAAAAPVPQVIEPVAGEPIVEPTKDELEAAATAVKPEVAVAEPVAPVEESSPAPAAVEAKSDDVKFDEAAKTDDKAPKRDLAKLARRLSGKVGGFLGTPKKEKKEKDLVPAVAATSADEPAASTSAEAPKIETPVDESKLDAAAPEAVKADEVVERVKADEPVEAAKLDEVIAPVDTTGEELAKDVEVKKEAEPFVATPAPVAVVA